jgi:hypothetical protein
MKPVIIIPTLNPDQRLINLVEKLKKGGIPIYACIYSYNIP